VPNNPDFRFTPDLTAILDDFDDRIAALDRRMAAFDLRMAVHDAQVRSALLACDAGAQSTVALAGMIDKQNEYIDALDVLWRARLVNACDRVMATADDNEPAPDDVLQVDLWHLGDDIVKRSEV
jgi:hypothetical protein